MHQNINSHTSCSSAPSYERLKINGPSCHSSYILPAPRQQTPGQEQPNRRSDSTNSSTFQARSLRLPGVNELNLHRPPLPERSCSDPRPMSCSTQPKQDTGSSEHPQSLRVYECPTATYYWPRFDPARKERTAESVIYVKYKPSSSPQDSQFTHSEPSSAHSRSSSHSGETDDEAPRWKTPYSRKRSSSIETESLPASPTDRFIKHPRTSQMQRSMHDVDQRDPDLPGSFTFSGSSTLSPADFRSAPPCRRGREGELPRILGRLDIESEQSTDDEGIGRPARSHPSSSSYQSQAPLRGPSAPLIRSHSASYPSGTGVSTSARVSQGPEEWMKWARPLKNHSINAMAQYTCSWPVHDSYGHTVECGYTSKRHLVKRHVESKHLQLRPCLCHICGKGFAQKSNLETHLNTHTGKAPHVCTYAGCGESFKDPARRHRHMKAVHGHVSSRSKKTRVEPDTSSTNNSEVEEGRASQCPDDPETGAP